MLVFLLYPIDGFIIELEKVLILEEKERIIINDRSDVDLT